VEVLASKLVRIPVHMLKIFRFRLGLLIWRYRGASTRRGSGFRRPSFAGLAMVATLLLLPMMMKN
jgi:hypothetical protein